MEDDETVKQFNADLESDLVKLNIKMINEQEVEIIKPAIGEGSFGKVYKAKYNSSLVALKKIKLKEENLDDPESTKKLILTEINNVVFAQMEGIPKFYGIMKISRKNIFCLVFELISGETLSKSIDKLNSKEKLIVLNKVSLYLSNLHKKNFIHRDLKPSNIMISDNLKVTLIDFGVSRIASRTSTFTSEALGSIRYSAPENQDPNLDSLDDKTIKISTKIDIWSLGCTISEVFSGILPWYQVAKNNNTVCMKLTKKVEFPIPKDEIVKNAGEKLGKEIVEIVKKCVDYDPKKRLNVDEVVGILQEKIDSYEK